MKDLTEQIYDELNAQVVRMLEDSARKTEIIVEQATSIAELTKQRDDAEARIANLDSFKRIAHMLKASLRASGGDAAEIAKLEAYLALQAPVREVPETDWISAITTPDNWRKIAEHGNPPEGFYMAIYKGDGKSMPVTLAGYGEYEFYSEDDDHETTGIGWVEYSEDQNGDCFNIVRDVIAYLPVNVDMASLKAVRASLPAAPVQQEGASNG